MKYLKYLAICGLSLMWLIYFIFEAVTGRITDLSTFVGNVSLIFLFALVGYIIYKLSIKYNKGISSSSVLFLITIFMVLDQGIKIIIKFFFFNNYKDIIPNILSFHPIINTDGSWLNARFGTSVSFPLLIALNALFIFFIIEAYRYFLHNNKVDFWGNMCFIFLFCGALCSLIDKVFYGGSLDFIGISDLFIADIKDLYINLGLYFLILASYASGYLTSEDSTLKEDLEKLKGFFKFVKKDLLRKQ